MTLETLTSEMDADDTIEITRADMVIKGNYRVTALFLQYYDELYEDRERQLQIDMTREQKALSNLNNPNLHLEIFSNPKLGKAKSKSKLPYPKPIEISRAYIKQFGKKYTKSVAIDFIKGYLGGRRLTLQYRRRVLMSIIDIVDNTASRFHQKKIKKVKSKRVYTKRNLGFWLSRKKDKPKPIIFSTATNSSVG